MNHIWHDGEFNGEASDIYLKLIGATIIEYKGLCVFL